MAHNYKVSVISSVKFWPQISEKKSFQTDQNCKKQTEQNCYTTHNN